jgi:PAS domain S-box-containing protein
MGGPRNDGTREGRNEGGTRRVRIIVGAAGTAYLFWWFTVELLLPGSFNPLASRLLVVGLIAVLLFASYRSRWLESRLSAFLTASLCVLVAHYTYLLIGNRGESTWWVGAFITFAATSMCVQTRREVLVFSLFAFGCALFAAALEGQLGNSIYLPGLATILLLAYLTKHSQISAQDAALETEIARKETRRSDEERLQLAAIVESSGDAIVGCGTEGLIRSWNKAAERLFGYTADEAVGRSSSLLLSPGHEGEDLGFIARLTKGELLEPIETSMRRKDGSSVDVSVTFSPVRGSAGNVVGASMAARDVSERKRAEAEAARAREVAEAANRELAAFSYSVAHDLRAPLRGIDGFSLALLEDQGSRLDESGLEYLRRVRNAVQKMGRLIDGLLELSRVTRADVRSQPVELSKLVRSAAERLKESDPGRKVQIEIRDGLCERGDPVLLGAVVENLLDNAWKFTRNRPDARIEFGYVEDGGRPAYFLRDNGAGFDMAYSAKLFGVFQRLHTPQEFEGTGIGLATVQRIVRRHGGRVWAEGKIGAGACFYFTLGDHSTEEPGKDQF